MSRHLLLIGAQRCGTTYLQGLLDEHPEITTARPGRPEPKVFSSEEKSARGLAWYRATYFAHATDERVLGEKSTSYLESATAAERAREVLGECDVVVLLRDPVARAVSNWRFSSQSGLETRPLARALRDNLRGPRAWDPARTSVSPYAYLERGRYADFLEPWSRTFPHSTHVLFLSELVSHSHVLTDLYDALGVSGAFEPAGRDRPVNQSDVEEPGLPTALLREVRDYFARSDAALARALGRELPWPMEASTTDVS